MRCVTRKFKFKQNNWSKKPINQFLFDFYLINQRIFQIIFIKICQIKAKKIYLINQIISKNYLIKEIKKLFVLKLFEFNRIRMFITRFIWIRFFARFEITTCTHTHTHVHTHVYVCAHMYDTCMCFSCVHIHTYTHTYMKNKVVSSYVRMWHHAHQRVCRHTIMRATVIIVAHTSRHFGYVWESSSIS